MSNSTVYPGGVDAFTLPLPSDNLDDWDHASGHTAEMLAIQALESKVGTGASTPALGKALVGTGGTATAWQPPVPAGTLLAFAGPEANVPQGYLVAAGQSLLRATYPDLFTAIGTTYGAADGTHFNLPDMRGRVAVALDNLGGTDSGRLGGGANDTLGYGAGEASHTLTSSEMPSHNHSHAHHIAQGQYPSVASGSGAGNVVHDAASGGIDTPVDATAAGGGAAHNNMQPYLILVYIIKT